jgi:hypothetical protein
VHPDGDRRSGHHRAQQEQPRAGPDDVDEPLHEEASLPLAIVHQRPHDDAVELFLHRMREDLLERIDRDADGLAFARGDPGDRLEQPAGGWGQADRHLVDDVCVQDSVDVVDVSEDRPRRDSLGLLWRREVPDDPEPEPGMLLHAVGEILRQVAGADHEHVARVATLGAVPGECGAQEQPADQGDRRLGDEQQCQEEAADIGLLDEEER